MEAPVIDQAEIARLKASMDLLAGDSDEGDDEYPCDGEPPPIEVPPTPEKLPDAGPSYMQARGKQMVTIWRVRQCSHAYRAVAGRRSLFSSREIYHLKCEICSNRRYATLAELEELIKDGHTAGIEKASEKLSTVHG